MATAYTTVEVWVLVDQFGECGIGRTAADAAEDYAAGNDPLPTEGRRMVKIAVKVPLPKPVELTAEVEEEAGGLKVA